MRRAELPLAQTEGFSPRPKMHFGLALSTSHESLGEYIDVDLTEPEAQALDLEALPGLLTPLLPPGLEVEAVAVVDRSDDSLQQAVTSCTWRIEVPGVTPSELTAQVAALLAATEVLVTRERKGKTTTDDIRGAIRSAEVVGATPPERVVPGAVVVAELGTQPRAVRPGELLAAMDPPREEGHVRRLHQWIESDGARQEPLPLATRTPHAEARAS